MSIVLGEVERGTFSIADGRRRALTAAELAAGVQRLAHRDVRLPVDELRRWLISQGLAVERGGLLTPTQLGRDIAEGLSLSPVGIVESVAPCAARGTL